jgi:hypothetical protein
MQQMADDDSTDEELDEDDFVVPYLSPVLADLAYNIISYNSSQEAAFAGVRPPNIASIPSTAPTEAVVIRPLLQARALALTPSHLALVAPLVDLPLLTAPPPTRTLQLEYQQHPWGPSGR